MTAISYITSRKHYLWSFPSQGWGGFTPLPKEPQSSCMAYVLWFNRVPHFIKVCGGVKHPYSLRHAWLASVCLGAALHSEVHGNCFLSKWLTALLSFLITVAIIILFMSVCCALSTWYSLWSLVIYNNTKWLFCLVCLNKLEGVLIGAVKFLHHYVVGSEACILEGIADVVSLNWRLCKIVCTSSNWLIHIFK